MSLPSHVPFLFSSFVDEFSVVGVHECSLIKCSFWSFFVSNGLSVHSNGHNKFALVVFEELRGVSPAGFFQHDVTEYVILVLTNFSAHRHIQKDNLTAWKFLPDYLYLCKIFLSRLAHLLMNLQQ